MLKLVQKLFGSRHDREVRKLDPIVMEVNRVCQELAGISDEELRGKTVEFRSRIEERTREVQEEIRELRETRRASTDADERERLGMAISELEGELRDQLDAILDELLPEAFAVVKETCRRLSGTEVLVTGQALVWDMVPYDVQLIGGITLHRGKVAEMATGEGKTLVATLPVYLNALTGRGVHVVTVNSYLARRDAEWMGTIYRYLGLTVDVIDVHDPGTPSRREAYRADITYGTNNEFGFDYLRDNMVHSLEQRVQRGHPFAIIDEVDSILIDEARTPLIISGPAGRDSSGEYRVYNPMVATLHRKQSRIINDLVSAAETDLAEGRAAEGGEKLLAVRRGAPRHKRLLKIFADDPGVQKLVQKVEADYMREKRLHELDELLLYAMDEKGHNVHLSDAGIEELSPGDPDAFVIPDLSEALAEIQRDEDLTVDEKRERTQALEGEYAAKSAKMHILHQLLKAYTLFHRDEQYIIAEDGSIAIVDEFTGRQMAGRRWSDGLHQAVEAKEGVEVKGETQTLATITIQNYFRMYDKLAGMTGTAETEENEFHQIYNLDVQVIPTNRPIQRDDRNDLIFRTRREKYSALIEEIERLHRLELPVLVGTTNVEISETFAKMLARRGIPHNVLNAKHHQREAEIVAGAGRLGAVTIATNMAGRGTDIKLGEGVTEPRTVGWARTRGLDLSELAPVDPTRDGDYAKKPDDFVIEKGGLHILGSARHESRRIDRQLRGRAGRQGDTGASQFFISLEDDLMRMFMSDRVAGAMEKLGAQEGEVITHSLVTKSIERAQKRVETNNFESRKRLLDYDDVMNQQREVVYDLRLFALEGGEDLMGELWDMISRNFQALVAEYCAGVPATWDLPALRRRLLQDFFVQIPQLPDAMGEDEEPEFDREEVEALVLQAGRAAFELKIADFAEHRDRVASYILLSVIDDKWKDHLYDLDHLKASISFRGWGQKDPLVEYKKEAYDMFVDLLADVRKTVSSFFFRAQIGLPQPVRPQPQPRAIPGDPADASFAGGSPAPSRVDETGVARASRVQGSASVSVGGVTGLGAPAPDPAKLQTNRAPQESGSAPAAAADAGPGRNDPCWCGSGKKFKKCHGSGS